MNTHTTEKPTPHFTNDIGVAVIKIGTKAFKCIGARPPMDHPHVFLEMGAATEITCPYCSTKYVFDAKIEATHANPPEAVYEEAKEDF